MQDLRSIRPRRPSSERASKLTAEVEADLTRRSSSIYASVTESILAGGALVIGVAVRCADTGLVVGPGWWVVVAPDGAAAVLSRHLKLLREHVELIPSYAEVV